MEERFNSPYIDIHTHIGGQVRSGVVEVESVSVAQADFAQKLTSGRPISVGIYPFDAHEATEDWFELLDQAMEHESVFAMGEIGLDNRPQYRPAAEVQRAVFARCIAISARHSKPIIVHQVKALDETLEELKAAQSPVIFHGFSGSSESAARILARGHNLSLGHLLLTNPRVQESLRIAPQGRIFLETDQSQHTIEEIYAKASQIMHISVDELKNQIYNNVNKLARENRATIG